MLRTLTAGAILGALTLGVALPASGQELGAIDLEPEEAPPGETVNVTFNDPTVIAEQCATTLEEVYAQYSLDGHRGEWQSRGPLVGIDVPDDDEWGTGPFDPPAPPPDDRDPLEYTWSVWRFFAERENPGAWAFTREDHAAQFLDFFMGLLRTRPEAAQPYLDATFVLTFADIATQEPLGDISGFDPETGTGEITVPDADPGLYVAAATCVKPEITDESFLAAIDAGAAWLEANDIPLTQSTWTTDEAILAPISEVMLAELMQPSGGPWAEFFCITDADGECPDDGEPPDDEPPDVDGPIGPGDGAGNGASEVPDDELPDGSDAGGGGAPAATPVSGTPSFTG